MKKMLLCLALPCCLASAAHAQSSVTITGTADGAVRYQTNANAAGGSRINMGSNGYYSSNKITYAGREDLGDGMNAHFLLETGFNLGTGAFDNTAGMLFNRQAYVGMSGAFGAVELGRQYTISHDFILDYDPFGFHYTPIIPLTQASSGTRFNNDVKYIGRLGPLKFEAEYSFGETAGSLSRGAAHGAGLQYTAGNLVLGAMYNRRSVPANNVFRDDDYYLVGGAYSIGAWRISGGHMSDRLINPGPAPDTVTRNSFGGLSYHASPAVTLTAGYYRTSVPTDSASRRDLSIVGLDYALSKRTKLYSEVDYTKYKNKSVSALNPVGVSNQTALTLGIDHRF
jgi:predicted porin